MASTRWYVEEPEQQWEQRHASPPHSPVAPVAAPAAPVFTAFPSVDGIAGLTDAQIAAIAREAGVTEDFVRQSLQASLLEQEAVTAPKNAPAQHGTDAEHWQVALRVKKPHPLPARQVSAVALSSFIVALISTGMLYWIRGPVLFLFAAPFVAFYGSMNLTSKRLGALAGASFAAGWLAVLLVAYRRAHPAYTAGEFLQASLAPALICLAVGAVMGLLGAIARDLVPVVRRHLGNR